MSKFLTTALVDPGVSASSAAFAGEKTITLAVQEHVMLGLPDHG